MEKTGRKVIQNTDGSILEERGASHWKQTEGKRKLKEVRESELKERVVIDIFKCTRWKEKKKKLAYCVSRKR